MCVCHSTLQPRRDMRLLIRALRSILRVIILSCSVLLNNTVLPQVAKVQRSVGMQPAERHETASIIQSGNDGDLPIFGATFINSRQARLHCCNGQVAAKDRRPSMPSRPEDLGDPTQPDLINTQHTSADRPVFLQLEKPQRNLQIHHSECATMNDNTSSQSLLQSVLGFFARKRPQRSAKSVGSRKREAWLRTDAFLQHDDLGEADPESVARTLHAFEHLIQDDSDREIDYVGVLDIQQISVSWSVGLSLPAY
jgi:hypothetical protein